MTWKKYHRISSDIKNDMAVESKNFMIHSNVNFSRSSFNYEKFEFKLRDHINFLLVFKSRKREFEFEQSFLSFFLGTKLVFL